ncbi:hypothetical protein ACRQ5Q_07455 [Bradyrhizobium sp. PMVTL-01]|uniref:hypothetical protein n=1 Tax=Bradyrhizobium sp. PMVTL-01 TaxID=3434999 RepID=UPI003F6ED5BA
MTLSAAGFCRVLPRSLRGAMAMFVMAMYLVAGLLHGVCDLDVTNSSSKIVLSLAEKAAGHSDKGSLADHHCHGCFSVSVPAPVVEAVALMPTVKVVPTLQVERRGLPPGIDPPPPKFLI